MKKYILLLLLAVITMNYQACQPKNDRIADLKDFVEEIAEDGNSAVVKFKQIYGNGEEEESEQKMVKVDGKWLMDIGK